MPITCRTVRIALTAASIACLLGPLIARASPEAAEAWFRTAWETPLPTIDDMHLRVIVESHETPTRAELAAWRREVEGRPDHPRRRDIEIAERRLARGPDVRTYDIWLGANGHGRINSTDHDGYEFDVAFDGRTAWGRAPAQLTVSSAGRIPPEYDHPGEIRRIQRLVQSLAAGGFSVANAGHGMRVTRFQATPDATTWTADAGLPEQGMMIRLSGTFDPATNTGLATEALVTQSDASPEELGRRWGYREWTSVANAPLATIAEEFLPNRTLELRHRVESARPLERGELQRVTALPDAKRQHDAVRGEIDALTLVDNRPRGGTVRVTPPPHPESDPVSEDAHPPPVRSFGLLWLLAIPAVAAAIGAGVLFRRHHA
ncbi:MAG: hypothetical protein EA378_08745 [Phycisphaerales bacterium]|nr:MAG: hypothetical protein EA378_08745 [Phycisphaerales bacterium]